MKTIAYIGKVDKTIKYIDRPTVKVVIKKDDKILLLNNGLLPGGGLDENESDKDAITRELQEELGVKVKDVAEIGTVIQYRNFIKKQYIVNGYTATLDTFEGFTSPQDEGEGRFTQRWMTIEEALRFLKESITRHGSEVMDDDMEQGRIFNLKTSYELLKQL